MSNMRDVVNRELLRSACSMRITCPHCGDVLDASEAVHASMMSAPRCYWFGCATCWGRAPVVIDQPTVDVVDGRLLFKTRDRFEACKTKRNRKGAV
jgi:hypothetical protein